jgi:uncharacterized protein YjdB
VNAATGKITAKRKGKTTITVTALNGKKLQVKVYVVTKAKKLTKVKFTGAPSKIKKGKTAQLKTKIYPTGTTNPRVKFASSKKSVIKVDKAGKITALKKGKAKITVRIGKKTYSKTITVK